jgi:Family of unknown function (DUF695)
MTFFFPESPRDPETHLRDHLWCSLPRQGRPGGVVPIQLVDNHPLPQHVLFHRLDIADDLRSRSRGCASFRRPLGLRALRIMRKDLAEDDYVRYRQEPHCGAPDNMGERFLMFPHCCGLRSRIRPVEHNGSRSPARWRGRAPHGRPAAMSHLPYAAYVKLRMNAPRPDGFSSNQEFETLNTIADALVASLAESALFRSAHVRGVTGILFRRVRCERLARRVSEFATMHPGCAFDSGSREDPDWQRYLEFLRPSPADRQRNREPARLLRNGRRSIDTSARDRSRCRFPNARSAVGLCSARGGA